MLEALVTAVQDSVKTETIGIGGKEFVTRPIYDPPEPVSVNTLRVNTLAAIGDYILNNIDDQDKTEIFVHVVSPVEVNICRYLRPSNKRDDLVEALCGSHAFQFGHQYDQETFIILLQSQFVETDNRKLLQKFVASLCDESSLRLQDNGVAQETATKVGVRNVDNAEVPNPIKLAPFRTFAEVEQPESPFILRLHRRDGEAPKISLHEADNHAWKLKAILEIATFLSDKTGSVPVLA